MKWRITTMRMIGIVRIINRTLEMFRSRAFWDGVTSVFLFGNVPARREPESEEFRRLRQEIEEYNNLSDVQRLARDWQRVNGYLWNSMDKFEAQYRKGFVKENERMRTHEEVFARFKKLTDEFDTPYITVKCAWCGTTKRVSKLQFMDGMRCRCGRLMVFVETTEQTKGA
jgi:hypothetical protein